MAEPYTGPNLPPITLGTPPPPASDGWDAFPVAPKAEAKADDWSAFPEAGTHGVVDTAKDVVKSAGSGIVKGAAALAGTIGDYSDFGAKGLEKASDFVSDKLGIDRYQPPSPDAREKSLLNYVPTAASLTKNFEDNVTPLHVPETTAGKFAETVGEFAPAALGGPGGVGKKLITQAVIPGVASEAAGEATEGSSLEPYARALAGVGAGVGAGILSRPGSATEAIKGRIPADLNAQHIADADKLIQSAKASGIDLTWPEALSHVYQSPVLTDTQRVLESAPQSRTKMQEFFKDRPQQFDQAGLNEFDKIAPGNSAPSMVGPAVSKAADDTLGGVRGAINKASDPYYQNAESVLLSPQEMVHVKSIPGYQEARDAVRKSPQLNSYVAHLPDNSVGFLNEVKKYFDQQKKNSSSKFNQGANQQVAAVHGKAAEALKQIGEYKSPDYVIALGIQKKAREKYLEPLLSGPLGKIAKKDMTTQKAIDVLFPSSPLPNSHNEVADAMTAIAKKNPWAANQLVRVYAESVFNAATKNLQGGANQAGAAKFAVRLVGNPQQRENLRAAIEALPNGAQKWEGFNKFLEAAEASGTRQGKGSLTAFNEEELKILSGSALPGEIAKTVTSPGKLMTYVGDKWGRWALGKNLNELASILTDSRSGRALQRIAAMPSKSRDAQVMAGRAILQAEEAMANTRDTKRK